MTAQEPIPFRPLGLIKTMLEDLGYCITHCYEDLIFTEQNTFLLRMEKQGDQISLFLNTESEIDKRDAIISALQTTATTLRLKITNRGTYSFFPNEQDQTIDINFMEHESNIL